MPEISEIHRCNAEAFGGGEMGRERQRKLYDAKIAVVGSGILAQSVLAGLYGLGINNITFFDGAESIKEDERSFLYERFSNTRFEKRSALIREGLDTINPAANLTARYGRFHEAFLHRDTPQIIIDATNSPSSKENVLSYATSFKYKHIPVISLSSDEWKATITTYWPAERSFFHQKQRLETLINESYALTKEGTFTSGVIAGLALEEVRKELFRYDGKDDHLPSTIPLTYNILSSSRTGTDDLQRPISDPYKGKNVLVVGAGAIGNWIAAYLPLTSAASIDFADYDFVEPKNLNRQVLLRGHVNEPKAAVLAGRVKHINPFVRSDALIGKLCDQLTLQDELQGTKRISTEEVLARNYDVILGAVDNKYARLLMDEFSVTHKKPYLDGGTSPKAGVVALSIPGKTRTIDQQVSLVSLPEGSHHCTDNPNPSVVMSNMIVGAAMVGELMHVCNEKNGDALPGTFNYASDIPRRLYVRKPRTREQT